MKLFTVIGQAWRAYREHWKALTLALLLELALRGIALAPLLFLATTQTRPLALLSVPLYLLIVLPARQNAALAMQDALSGGSPLSPRLISGEDYGRKLLRGLKAALRMLLWSLPLIAVVTVALWSTGVLKLLLGVGNNPDGMTLYRTIRSMGGNDIDRGLALILIIFLLSLIPLLVGCAFHYGTRHAEALGDPRLIKGRRGRMMLLWLVSLVFCVPFFAAATLPLASYAQALVVAKDEFFATLTLNIPSPSRTLIIEAVLLLLLLPAIPLRTLVPAVYLRAEQAQSAEATTTDAP